MNSILGKSAPEGPQPGQNAPPLYYTPQEQALLSPQFGLANGGLQQMRNWADQQARIQTALTDAGLAAGGEFLPALWGLRGTPLLEGAAKAFGATTDLAGNMFDMTENQRANNIYNRAASDTINNSLTAQSRAQSENSGGRMLRGFLGP